MINGIPIKIKTRKGEEVQPETIFIATFRKCPKLKESSKELTKLQVKLTKAVKLEDVYLQKLNKVDADKSKDFEKEINDLTNKYDEHKEQVEDITNELCEKSVDFLVTALVGAGYTKKQADSYADYFPQERFFEVLDAARTGAMRVIDFFTEKSQPEQS